MTWDSGDRPDYDAPRPLTVAVATLIVAIAAAVLIVLLGARL